MVLDTHVLVWLRAGDARLGRRCRRAIETAHDRGELAVSAISFWEAAMLQATGRLKLAMGPTQWRARVLGDGVAEIAVSGDIGIRATELLSHHPDPADRLIVASAAMHSATLYTADTALLDQSGAIEVADATV